MKLYTVEAKDAAGQLVFSVTKGPRKDQPATMREALAALGFGAGLIRAQQVGAKSWAIYRKHEGVAGAHLDLKAAWE